MSNLNKKEQQQPKLLLHRPRKSQRVTSGPSSAAPKTPGNVGGASPVGPTSSRNDGGAKSVSTSTIPTEPRKPIWYRYRTILMSSLVASALFVGYTLFRKNYEQSQLPHEAEVTEDKVKEAEAVGNLATEQPQLTRKGEGVEPQHVDNKNETAFITAVTEQPKVMLTPTPQQQMIYEAVGKLNFSAEEQQELFQWILSEKRKMKAKTKAEKGQIDAEKALLKEFIRGKKAFDV
ncbi:hypothetical protein KP509_37G038500 [Ceratopteris richardii]|uniref:Uncharacterized protein n=1 Tax=Ceratopteris richardii TaxID=49495 RepID=A0A8T2Q817_CERRI|nr:hypothetical protein KP509_37G038500 [Ceratopteris richardii]KAH7279816.1 hypothetical protein KP509_37G038500 [Ceratopteris richardii]